MRRTVDPRILPLLTPVNMARARSLALVFTRNLPEAEDVVQEAFVRVLLYIDRWEGRARIESWFYRVVVNVGLMSLRRRRHNPVLESGLEDVPDPIAHEPFEELKESDLHALLKEMSPASRQVYHLLVFEGLPPVDIARRLQVPRGTVLSRIFYLRQRIRRWLEEFA